VNAVHVRVCISMNFSVRVSMSVIGAIMTRDAMVRLSPINTYFTHDLNPNTETYAV